MKKKAETRRGAHKNPASVPTKKETKGEAKNLAQQPRGGKGMGCAKSWKLGKSSTVGELPGVGKE